MANNELWEGMRIPIIVNSGEVNSGKTLFALDIDPTCRLPKEATPTTVVFDQEGSAEPYVNGLNFRWVDIRKAIFDGVHRGVMPVGPNDPKWLKLLKSRAEVNDFPAASMFRAAYLSLLGIEPGRYRVLAFDTFTPIQDGMVEWLRAHPEAFDRTKNQYEKASSMFLWPDVKAMLSHILAVDCRLRFETVVLNVHLKSKWEGDRKTKERIAEGLDVLDKLATLHIELSRAPDKDGKVPRAPVGILKKERLVQFGKNPEDDMPILPPRIENCTPNAIRAYIRSPSNYAKLKASERVPETPITEVELQTLRLHTAEAEEAAAMARASLLERQRELAALRGNPGYPAAQLTPVRVAPPAHAPVAPPPATKPDPTPTQAEVDAAKATADARIAASAERGRELAASQPAEDRPVGQAPPAANGRVERFKRLLVDSHVDPQKIAAAMQQHGAKRFTELSTEHQDALLIVLQKAADAKAEIPF